MGEPAQIYIRALDEPAGRSIARRDAMPCDSPVDDEGQDPVLGRDGALVRLARRRAARARGRHRIRRARHLQRTSRGTAQTVATVARSEDGSFGIWTATPLGADLERYEPAPFAARRHYNEPFLRFSPDGRQLLLFWYAADRGEEAWLMPFPPDANSPPHRILQDLPALGGTPEFSWLPDNRHIVLSTGSGLQRGLYLADTQSGKYRLLTSGPSNQMNPVVSPDGSRPRARRPKTRLRYRDARSRDGRTSTRLIARPIARKYFLRGRPARRRSFTSRIVAASGRSGCTSRRSSTGRSSRHAHLRPRRCT